MPPVAKPTLYNLYIYLVTFLLFTNLPACKRATNDPVLDDPIWQAITDTSMAVRKEASCFAIGTKVYFGLGLKSINTSPSAGSLFSTPQLSDFWEFDTTTKKWRKLADFPGGKRSGCTAFALNGKGFIALGYSNRCSSQSGLCDFTYYRDVWEYNSVSNTWKMVTTADDIVDTRYARSLAINDKAYILTAGKVYEFNSVSYAISQKASFNGVGVGASTFTINNKGYACLGLSFLNEKPVYEYDPAIDTWTKKKDFPGESRGFMAGFGLNGSGYVGGGYQQGNPYQYFKDFWKYDPVSDQWTKLDDYPGRGSEWLCSSVTANTAVIGSGQGLQNGGLRETNDFWLFQPK